MNPKISVVIPAYNRPDLLEKTIKAVENQSLKKTDFECILVYGKDRKVMDLCRKKSMQSPVFSCFQSMSESPSKKRNIGIKKAKGNIVAFTDDDCIPDKNWLSEIVKSFKENSKISGVEGLTYTKGKKELYSNAPVNEKGGLFPTCNLSFRKIVLQKISGFDEAYYFYREDTDIAFRAMDFGEVIFCNKVKVFHPQRKVGLLRPLETIKLLKEDVRLYKKLPEKYRKYLWAYAKTDILKSIIGWGVFIVIITGLYIGSWEVFVPGIVFYILFWALRIRELKSNLPEFSVFVFLNFIKAIIFPFYFLYYLVSVK